MRHIQKHHKYRRIPKNDIAYVDLESPISEADFSPICLTHSSSSFIGEVGTVVTYAPVTPLELLNHDIGELRGAQIKVVPKEKCRDSEGRNAEVVVPTDGFCAGEGKKAYLCHGDSGGGLYKRLDGKWFLRGVLSTGLVDAETKNCAPNDYVIFMDVARYQGFVNSQLQDSIGFDVS